MIVVRVSENVVSTENSDSILGMKRLLVNEVDISTQKEINAPLVAIDKIGASQGEMVLCVAQSPSKQITDTNHVDLVIVGIIDSIKMVGVTIFEKNKSE